MGKPDAEWLVGQRCFVRCLSWFRHLCLNGLSCFMISYTL